MLSHLHIRNFAIAPRLDLEFGAGFTAITGETGAGKSILVDALGLLLGDRSDAAWVMDGAERADLSAEFDVSDNPAAVSWLRDNGLDQHGQCLLRRSIAANGRSRAWANGTPVTVQQLSELGELLVELHGQNEHLSLTRPGRQSRLIDESGDYAEALQAVRDRHAEWKELEASLEALLADSALSAGELELLRHQHEELLQHSLSPEQLEELEAEHRRLSRSGEMFETLTSALATLTAEDGALADQLHRTGNRLQPLAELDPDVAEARRMLEEAAINTQEAGASLRQAIERVDLSPERLEAVRRQLDVLGDLARKHRVPLERLAEVRDDLARRLQRAEHFAEHRDEMEQRRNAALAEYRQCATELSRRRRRHAQSLAQRVTDLMSELGMRGGVFEIQVEHLPERPPTRRGDDRIELKVSANPGVPPGPLARVASGGELSRISLAIKVAAAGGDARSQVFDEVDAGIGGETANAVGHLLHRLAAGGQALCVTHLAQVAACARQQLRVDKQTTDSTVQVDTRLLDEQQRVEEIARMLSGRSSKQSLAHARELLDSAPA